MASGGAAASLDVLQFFEDIGIPIIEGYGLTEAASSVTVGKRFSPKKKKSLSALIISYFLSIF
jgi:long-subunit acyl-CoA synthetase (AMP-forming)